MRGVLQRALHLGQGSAPLPLDAEYGGIRMGRRGPGPATHSTQCVCATRES